MTRRNYYAIEFISAGILTATAHNFLLTPDRQRLLHWAGQDYLLPVTAISFFLVSILSWVALLIGTGGRTRTLVNTLRVISLAVLAWLYFEQQLIIEAIAIVSLALASPITFQLNRKKRTREISPLTLWLTLSNLAIAVYLFIIPDFLQIPYYITQGNIFHYIGIIFLFAAISGGIALLLPKKRISRSIQKIITLPWVVWGMLFFRKADLSILIPAFFLATSIFSANLIPWERLIPPKPHRLTLQIAPALAIMYILIVLLVSTQLANMADVASNSEITELIRTGRDIAFILMLTLTIVLGYVIGFINITLHDAINLAPEQKKSQLAITQPRAVSDHQRANDILTAQLQHLSTQLLNEKQRTEQLSLLEELRHQLVNQHDESVIAQLAVNTLQRTLDCALVCIMTYDQDCQELVMLAVAGPTANTIPTGYRQSTQQGIIGRAARLKKIQIANNTRLDPDFFQLEHQSVLSEAAIPILRQGYLQGVLLVNDLKIMAFNNVDIATIEAFTSEVQQAWELGGYQRRLTELIHAGVSFSSLLEPSSAIREIAMVARQTLEARFVFVMLLDQDGLYSRTASAGHAPELMKTLSQGTTSHPLVSAALNATSIFRVRDVRKYNMEAQLHLDNRYLQSFMGIPVRLHRLSIGAILAFGKTTSLFFTERDESLANLLTSQAAAAVESSWLYNELRTTMSTATLLYQLSFEILKASTMSEKARIIAETAHKIIQAKTTGIVLFDSSGAIIAQAEVDSDGIRPGENHPIQTIQQTLLTNERIILAADNGLLNVCIPLSTTSRKHGALWMVITETQWYNSHQSAGLQTLANQVAIALERTILLNESQQQARELQRAYRELETTYDQTLSALMSALDARDRETEGHSVRVGLLAARLGEKFGIEKHELKILARGSLLHDIGKIGISDSILYKPGPLTESEWEIMRTHPDIGAEIVRGIPFLEDTIPIIRHHQERWNGSGYPLGLAGKKIPQLARIFAVVDALDALTSTRPYREKLPIEEALEYLKQEAGTLFDPEIIEALVELTETGKIEELLQ